MELVWNNRLQQNTMIQMKIFTGSRCVLLKMSLMYKK